MRSIVMQESLGLPLTDRDITKIETHLGMSLPLDYAAFLHEHNGGHPEPSVFRVYNRLYGEQSADDSPYSERVLAFFLGLSLDKHNDLLEFAKLSENRVPPGLLPIGRDVSGNLICLAVSGPNKGKVYWWFHEREVDEGEPPTYDNIYLVANTFSELLDSLTELPDEHEEQS